MTIRKRTGAPPRSPSTSADRAVDESPHAPPAPRRETRLPRDWATEPDVAPDAGRGKWHRVVRD
jgi:hypothetical protein